jgi:UDP-N-acetylglucosamine 2-epimerase (non-hydrolysing)
MTERLPLYLVAGARPNFVKLAPLVKKLEEARLADQQSLPFQIVHTGQHYDDSLSQSFFRTLGIPQPEINLEVGSGTHAAQTARILERFERLLLDKPARAVVVFGDVNSTLACAVTCSKLQTPLVHVEAGLRSFDRTMPEEINRIVTDVLADLLLVSEDSGLANLAREGIPASKIHLVGNIMIDSLQQALPAALQRRAHERLGLAPGEYALLTLHRPSNVDDPVTLALLLRLFDQIADQLPVIFPIHPRTQKLIAGLDGEKQPRNPAFRQVAPVDYIDSLCLQKHARLVLTDSGGMQEETTILNTPCLTLRENTERPVTVALGTSTLVGSDPQRILAALQDVLEGRYKQAQPIPLWDGQTAGRIVDIIHARYA